MEETPRVTLCFESPLLFGNKIIIMIKWPNDLLDKQFNFNVHPLDGWHQIPIIALQKVRQDS
jgi:hypothetical protein